MPCTPETERCVYWDDADYLRPDCCTLILKECLFYTADMLESMGVVWWLDYGTLLGAYRHKGQFVPWDTDCDVGVLERDVPSFVERAEQIRKDGFLLSLHDKDRVRNIPTLLRINRSPTNRQHCDLWPFRFGEGRVYRQHPYPGARPDPDASPLWSSSEFFDRLGTINLYGREFPCPTPVSEFLRVRYGSEFMVSKRWLEPLSGRPQ